MHAYYWVALGCSVVLKNQYHLTLAIINKKEDNRLIKYCKYTVLFYVFTIQLFNKAEEDKMEIILWNYYFR